MSKDICLCAQVADGIGEFGHAVPSPDILPSLVFLRASFSPWIPEAVAVPWRAYGLIRRPGLLRLKGGKYGLILFKRSGTCLYLGTHLELRPARGHRVVLFLRISGNFPHRPPVPSAPLYGQ